MSGTISAMIEFRRVCVCDRCEWAWLPLVPVEQVKRCAHCKSRSWNRGAVAQKFQSAGTDRNRLRPEAAGSTPASSTKIQDSVLVRFEDL